MKTSLALTTSAIVALLSGCASEPPPSQALQPEAVRVAQQRGASELGCAAAGTEVLTAETIQEAQTTGWYEPPHRAEYTVHVTGCGKSTTYSVACDERQKSCVAGPLAAPPQRARELADKLQPGAVKLAEQTGAAELKCPSTTAEVLRAETIQEVQTTGWYEPPRRAAYNIAVSGCGNSTAYLITCDDWKKSCAAGALQKAEAGAPPPPVVAETQAEAVRAAQQRGAAELECPAAATEVLRAEAIQQVQTTGWYEPPYQAVYSIAVSGCGKRTVYVVACDNRKKNCIPGHVQTE
jgi:tartrate dehydratase beta subunit/fumarate hydratase class I family protein